MWLFRIGLICTHDTNFEDKKWCSVNQWQRLLWLDVRSMSLPIGHSIMNKMQPSDIQVKIVLTHRGCIGQFLKWSDYVRWPTAKWITESKEVNRGGNHASNETRVGGAKFCMQSPLVPLFHNELFMEEFLLTILQGHHIMLVDDQTEPNGTTFP